MIGAMDRIWKLGHVYDVTQYIIDSANAGKILRGEENVYRHGYFICHDVRDTHIYRIQVGINSEYEKEPRTKIIEQEDISHEDFLEYCIEKYNLAAESFESIDSREIIEWLIADLGLEEVLKAFVDMDFHERCLESWDVKEYRYDTPLETLIRYIDGGYGITKINLENVESELELE